MDENHLQQPLLPSANHHASTTETTTTTTIFWGPESNYVDKVISSNYAIPTRLFMILLIGIVSIWADHEASKGFKITVINDVNTPMGEKFTLFYVSNDEAIRLVQSSFNFASKIMFPHDYSIEKLFDQIDIKLGSHNFTYDHTISMKSFGENRKYILSINPFLMEFVDFKYRIRKEIQRGIAEILLFDQRLRAPNTLLDGMVEYVSGLAGFDWSNPMLKSRNSGGRCWEDRDPRVVAKFLAYGEEKSEGLVWRMNQEMNRNGWYDGIMDKVLGISAIHLCTSFHDSMIKT